MYLLTESRAVAAAKPPFYDRPQATKYAISVKKYPPRAGFSVK